MERTKTAFQDAQIKQEFRHDLLKIIKRLEKQRAILRHVTDAAGLLETDSEIHATGVALGGVIQSLVNRVRTLGLTSTGGQRE